MLKVTSLKPSNVWYFRIIKKSYKRYKILELSFDTILLQSENIK